MLSMKSRFLLVGASSLLTVSICYADEAAKPAPGTQETIVAIVNGAPIPHARVDALAKAPLAQGQPDTPEFRAALHDQVIAYEVIAQEAAKKGLDKNPEVIAQIDLARQSVLTRAFLDDFVKNNPVGDNALKAEYDKIKAQAGDKEYKARHILVKTEQEAKSIIAKLKKGEKFEKLAEKSEDPGSKSHGGDLGWFPGGKMVKPFSDAVAGLNKGKTTENPVKTDFGWHVIRLDDVRPLQFPPFEALRDDLARQLMQQQISKIVADLKAAARIEIPGATTEKTEKK